MTKPPSRRRRPVPSGRRRLPSPAARQRARSKKQRQTAFLDALALCGNITVAAEATGLTRTLCQHWCTHDTAFKKAFDEAMATAFDRLLQTAWERALNGEEVPYYYRGEQVGSYQRRSDQLIMFLLRFVQQLQTKPGEGTDTDTDTDNLASQKHQLLLLLSRFEKDIPNRDIPNEPHPK